MNSTICDMPTPGVNSVQEAEKIIKQMQRQEDRSMVCNKTIMDANLDEFDFNDQQFMQKQNKEPDMAKAK